MPPLCPDAFSLGGGVGATRPRDSREIRRAFRPPDPRSPTAGRAALAPSRVALTGFGTDIPDPIPKEEVFNALVFLVQDRAGVLAVQHRLNGGGGRHQEPRAWLPVPRLPK